MRSGFVAIVGRPNVGKSTLTNLLVGEKVTIVSDVPQTTRRLIRGICNHPGGQMVLVDTPGIHRPRHAMNRWMVGEATGAIDDVDLIVFMIEAVGPTGRPAGGLGPGDHYIIKQLPRQSPPTILAINKVDQVRKERLLPLIDAVRKVFPFREYLLISALTGEGTETLANTLLSYLPEGLPLFPSDSPTDETERALASEIIREKILHHTRQEIPHETCVLIDVYEESKDLVRIEALVLVERESQRRILIGREGSMLKTVGTEARRELEERLDRKVYVRILVKVRGGWRDDRAVLRRLGMTPPG